MAEPFQDWLFEDTEEGDIPGFTEDDWLEALDDKRTDTITRDRSSCNLTIYVPFAKYMSAKKYVLGYSWVDAEKKLRREIPVFHPQNNWLWARSVSTTFEDWQGKEIAAWEYSHYYATFAWARMAIEFSQESHKVLDDNSPALEETTQPDGTSRIVETGRYVFRKSKPYGELIQVEGGFLKAHAPGIALLNQTNPINGPYVLAGTQKSLYTLMWKEVPKEFFEDDDGRQPVFEAMQKKTNKYDFMGHPPNTLLCEDIDDVPTTAPVLTDVFDELLFTADVTFTFKRFDPTPGDSTVAKRGWNLLPAARALAGATGRSAVAWVYYTHDGTLEGEPLYESINFNAAFQHYSLYTP